LEFENDPLTFLLIFCDSIQEWGRPTMRERQAGYEPTGDLFFLKDFKCSISEKKVEVILKTSQCRNNDPRYKWKEDEITEVSAFLEQSKEMKFLVLLEDNTGHTHTCEMAS